MNHRKEIYLISIAITLIHLFIHLLIIRDYPVAWDYHYHHYAGLYHLGLPVPSINDPSSIPFAPPDPRLTTQDPFGPFTQIIPSLSQVILSDRLHLLPFDIAYNLPIVVIGSFGVGVLFIFVAQSIGLWQGMFSAIFLSLIPVYFGYVHTSMKDVGNAAAFAFAIFLFWRLATYQRLRELIMAVISFAIAFNIKINSAVIPIICGLWYVTKFKFRILVLSYFPLAAIAAVALWFPFWRDPSGKLLQLPNFYSHNTLGMPVLLLGKLYQSGINIPFSYPWIYIGVSLPLGILLTSIIGTIIAFTKSSKGKHIYTLILLWLFVPLLRYVSSSTGAIDGIRHFLEIVYPLSILAAIGLYSIIRIIFDKWGRTPAILATFAIIVPLIYNVIHFHPYQTSFFNAFAGGIKGAQSKFDIDFWGTPQRQAIEWINTNAPSGSTVYVAMAQSSAALYAREDLKRLLNIKSIWESDYSVVLNRQSFFEFGDLKQYVNERVNTKSVVYTVSIDNVPLAWIVKN